MKIVVLAGGLSPERDVSLSSGRLIANALIERGHAVCLLDAYPDAPAPVFLCESLSPATIPHAAPDLEALIAQNGGRRTPLGRGVVDACAAADAVFLALHGAAGENGQIQAVFDCLGIRYTGTGYVGSLLAMDKDLSKHLCRDAGIPTPEWAIVRPEDTADSPVGFPCVVKPIGCGSSIGVSLVDGVPALREALSAAAVYGEHVIIERQILGREFSVGILMGEALPPIEIRPLKGFYDYQNKYQPGLTEEICPAPLPADETKCLQSLALRVHNTLHLGSYSRIDFIRDEAGTFWCLEANTLPGMTPTSLLPQEAAAVGISYSELCHRIVNAARIGTAL